MDLKIGNFNCFQNTPKLRVTNPVSKLSPLHADTVSFSGKTEQSNNSSGVSDDIMKLLYGDDPLEKLVPENKGTIYKKVRDENGKVIKTIPVKVDIVKTEPDKFQFEIDGDIIGHVKLSYVPELECNKDCMDYLSKDYKEEGIVGDRIVVEFVKNLREKEYGGIAHLADLLEVDACRKLGFEPNVVSESLKDVAPLHYKRGKRFVPYEKYMNVYDLMKAGGKNPNEIVEELIATTPEGQKYDGSELSTNLVMYMPKEMIKELEEELKENPIF